MSVFREHRFWSPILGCAAVRLSMVDKRGSEFFKIIPVADGFTTDDNNRRVPLHRLERERALDDIEDAIARGDEPGEVA